MIKKIIFMLLLGFLCLPLPIKANKEDQLNSEHFKIRLSELLPGGEINDSASQLQNSTQIANLVLGTIIQKLMIALGSVALLIMTVGGGYMILAHGQDELLSKGKSIFISGIISLVVALSAYYMVSFIRFVLYTTGQ